MKISNITINGIEQTEQTTIGFSDENLKLEKSIKVGQTSRGVSHKTEVSLKQNQIIEFIYDDGTTWISGPDTLDDIYPELYYSAERSVGDTFEIPSDISFDDAERGAANRVLLKIVNIFSKKAIKHEVRDLALRLEDKQLDDTIGLFGLSEEMELITPKFDEGEEPYLLFIHGTASSIKGSFDKVPGTELMTYINDTYKGRVLAFQHRTLTENPLKNVLDLVTALPKTCKLHLITSSRGGLIGETLSRFCNGNISNTGFTDAELSLLQKEYPDNYYQSILEWIQEIRKVVQTKNIVIEKFIRVACPADGTTLASKRTDIFLNFLLNLVGIGTGIAATPAFIAFKNLITAVVDSKHDVNVLPGLEVQSPKSPFIKVLNSVYNQENADKTIVIDNSLIVIAGNSQPAKKLSALLIIASKLFFRAKNDLVVDTGSMSLGTRRTGRVQQFFYEGNDINHFKYFENRTTNSEIVRALKSKWGEKMPGFTEQDLNLAAEAQRNAVLKLDGGKVFTDKVSGIKPIVVLLPGIMGSNLSLEDEVIWINYWKFITGGLKNLTDNSIEATSLVSTSYRKLVEFLMTDYDVVTFPFDWRLSLEEAVGKLDEKLKGLLKKGKPIKLIGHSMGGVLIRDFMVRHRDDTWAELKKSDGFKVLFLGSPLKGSFRIPAVLFGKDPIIAKLDKIDLFHSEEDLISMFSGFRGILGLLPFTTDADNDFAKPETWHKMMAGVVDDSEMVAWAKKQNAKNGTNQHETKLPWPIPSPDDLEWFKDYRDNALKSIQNEDFKNTVYIAGKDSETKCAYLIETKSSGKELVFLSTAEGDQSVTWDSGIPKVMIENDSVYYVDVSHGSLACEPDMFKGLLEILEKGSTGLFSKIRPTTRDVEKLFRSPEFRDFDLSQFGIEDTLLGRKQKSQLRVSEAPIRISVSQGDLLYAQYPVLAGHFNNDGILAAEKSVNEALNGILTQQNQLGIYPGDIGTCDLFVTKQSSFNGAVIVGLGEIGSLTASELTKTVEQGISFYLLRHVNGKSCQENKADKQEKIGISSVIIGCGYGGLPVNSSIKAIIQGVNNANNKVRNLKLENTRLIEHIEFIEKFKDKAVSVFFTVNKIAEEEANSFKIVMEGKGIKTLLGLGERIPMETAEGWWNRVTISANKEPKCADEGEIVESLEFSVSTNSSREEKQQLLSTPVLIETIISDMSTDNNWTPESAKTIFELLIPNGFKDQLKKHGDISWIVDEYSAAYPWELLQDNVEHAKPLCISGGMVRQLKTSNYRTKIESVTGNNVLVVADPDLKGFVNQLPGAYKEGQIVVDVLAAQGMNVIKSLNKNHIDIIQKLFSNNYKIIHLSGHGVFNKDISKGSGMVIGENLFLSTREINQMSTVPELVFVNCCHLGKTDGGAEKYYRDRYKLASNIGTQLIQNGVKCVVAAGWAVNDNDALEFARIFYQRMFEGYNFGESIKEARNAIYKDFGTSNTWGAYQCYGDPFYTFDNLRRGITGTRKKEKKYLIAQQAEVDLSNLLYDLEIGKLPTEEYIDELNSISKAVDEANIRNPEITEKEGLVYFELRDYDLACVKFGELLKEEEASFSFSVAEKYCNTRAKKIISDYSKESNPENNSTYKEKIQNVISDLETLNKLSPTSERLNILASTYKRKGLILSAKNEREGKKNAYEKAIEYYKNAYNNLNNWYSLTNWLIFESLFILMGIHKWDTKKSKPETLRIPSKNEVLKMLDGCKNELVENTEQMSYWDMLAGINIRLCQYFVQFSDSKSHANLDVIFREIKELWKIAGSKGKRFAEIEHLEFIIDALKMGDEAKGKEKVEQLTDEINRLKMELNKLM